MSVFLMFQKLVDNFSPGSTVVKAISLTGGISAQTTRLDVRHTGGRLQSYVVRRHGPVDLQNNPYIARDEFRLLEALSAHDLPVPAPRFVDTTTFETPCIVLQYIDGSNPFEPHDTMECVRQQAQVLARIHRVQPAHLMFDFLPAQPSRYTNRLHNRPDTTDGSLSEGVIRNALESVWELPQVNSISLLHGDYWAGNVLFRDDRLIAVIDWEDAMLGDPLADLGDIRLATLWSYGRDAMHELTITYEQTMSHLDYRYLPYWDLCAALRPISRFSDWASTPLQAQSMKVEHRWFVDQALANLP